MLATNLSSGVEADALKSLSSNNVGCDKEIGEQGKVELLQLGKVGNVHVRGEVCVRHIVAEGSHLLNEFFNRLQEVESDEFDAVVLPEQLLWCSPRCDDNLGPKKQGQ